MVVTEWDKANLSSEQQTAIQKLTDAYYAAPDKAGRDAAHNAAQAIREQGIGSVPKLPTGGTVNTSNYVAYIYVPTAYDIIVGAIRVTQPALSIQEVKKTAAEWMTLSAAPSTAKVPSQSVGVVTSKNPPTAKDGYVPPNGGPQKAKTKNGAVGWKDKNGNIWVPVPASSPLAHGGEHWDVNNPSGTGYSNIYPGGKVRTGSGQSPKIPNVKIDTTDQSEFDTESIPIQKASPKQNVEEFPIPEPVPTPTPTPNFPANQMPTQNERFDANNTGDAASAILEVGGAVVVGVVIYEVVKWGVAIIVSPVTGGASIGVAVVMP
jgi:hypothetical protein